MGIRIEERFEVAAPPERVWAYLVDPARVVGCLPGAELVETTPDGGFVGRMKVKVGPVTAAYRGRARFVELDEAGRHARLTAEGQETGGAGSARMSMVSEVASADGAGSTVRVEVDVEVVGKLAQFGRGMIEEVSRQMFRQFAGCVRATLEAPEPAAPQAPSEPAAGPASAFARASAPATTAGAAPPPAPGASPTAAPAVAASEPLRVLPLLWAAFKAWLRRVLGGKRSPAA